MNILIQKLHNIAAKPKRTVLGMMSGTSLDGLDLALCDIQGHGKETTLEVLRFVTEPYDDIFREKIQRVFAKQLVQQADISGLHALIAARHGEMVKDALASWGLVAEDIDLLASHGQTIFHAPARDTQGLYPNNTLQIGDGDHLAVATGIITLSDFRQKHVAAGGEGAPLVLYGDFLMFSETEEDRILLNMGGIANFTYLPSSQSIKKGKRPLATDTGPANTLLNQYAQEYLGVQMDRDAEIASQGQVSDALLNSLLQHEFFRREYPKTTGPELFNLSYLQAAQQDSQTETLSAEDILATLCAFTAESVVRGIRSVTVGGERDFRLFASGGGLHNPLLVKMIEQRLEKNMEAFEVLGLPGDAKEAALFAVLANETVAGNPESLKNLVGVPRVSMGKISLPH